MAEALGTTVSSADEAKDKCESQECAVCLQPFVHPAKLPCGHIFCFLCVKGIANQSKRCAMCRQEIPRDFIEQPNLLNVPPATSGELSTGGFDGAYQWFYEGRNGWWQYDERTSKELESCYKSGERSCELLIAGFLYVADLDAMLQLRRNDPSRRRRIKRDLATIQKKGIAGLRTEEQETFAPDTINPNNNNNNDRVETLTPVTPSNTPQTPASGRQSPRQNVELAVTMDMFNLLHIRHENEDNNEEY